MDQDTSPERLRQYIEHLRRLTPAERGRILVSLTTGVRRLAELGIRQRFPNISEDEVRVRLAVRLYGRSTAARAFPVIPEDAV